MADHGSPQRPRQDKRFCVCCRQRPSARVRSLRARFQYRGVVKADRDHTLCFECFRAAANRLRARGPYFPMRVQQNPEQQNPDLQNPDLQNPEPRTLNLEPLNLEPSPVSA